jgi:hypothetical protein
MLTHTQKKTAESIVNRFETSEVLGDYNVAPSLCVDPPRPWLASNANEALPPTVYRMDAFQRLMDQDFWNPELSLVVRNKEISKEYQTDQGLPVTGVADINLIAQLTA